MISLECLQYQNILDRCTSNNFTLILAYNLHLYSHFSNVFKVSYKSSLTVHFTKKNVSVSLFNYWRFWISLRLNLASHVLWTAILLIPVTLFKEPNQSLALLNFGFRKRIAFWVCFFWYSLVLLSVFKTMKQ